MKIQQISKYFIVEVKYSVLINTDKNYKNQNKIKFSKVLSHKINRTKS
jgi:hypothetical protein